MLCCIDVLAAHFVDILQFSFYQTSKNFQFKTLQKLQSIKIVLGTRAHEGIGTDGNMTTRNILKSII